MVTCGERANGRIRNLWAAILRTARRQTCRRLGKGAGCPHRRRLMQEAEIPVPPDARMVAHPENKSVPLSTLLRCAQRDAF
ncbi:hypothetical protein GCM10009794_03870 [Rothia terrae]